MVLAAWKWGHTGLVVLAVIIVILLVVRMSTRKSAEDEQVGDQSPLGTSEEEGESEGGGQ